MLKDKIFFFLVDNGFHSTTVSVSAIAVLTLGLLLFLSLLKPDSAQRSSIPGSLGFPFLGETLSFYAAAGSDKGFYKFVKERHLRYGGLFKTRVLGKTHVFFSSVEAAKAILGDESKIFEKSFMKPMKDLAGKKSVFSVSIQAHDRMRRFMSDPFSMNSLSKYVNKFDGLLCRKLGEQSKSFKSLDFTLRLSFDGICKMFMSITDPNLLDQLFAETHTISFAMSSLPISVPGTTYYKGVQARKRLSEVLEGIVARRRSGEEWSDDFLQAMLKRELQPEASEGLDDEEIVHNLVTFMLTGESTTAAAMMWGVKLLDENKLVQDKLREEQLAIHRNKPQGYALTFEDIKSMSYCSKVVKEILRMSNIILWYPRVAMEDCTIQGQEIKKGWFVNVDATHIHFDPNNYENPMQFNPSRFDERPKPYTFIPYAVGSRACMGINMAEITMVAFLHRLTTGYRWTVDDLDPSMERYAYIPRLSSGCPVTLMPLKVQEYGTTT